MTMKRIANIIVAVVITILAIYGTRNIQQSHRKLELNKIEIQSTDVRLKKLQSDYSESLNEIEKGKLTEQQLKELQEKLDKLEREKQDLKNQLQAKLNAKKNTAYASTLPDSSPVANCGDNQYANYIYMRESSCKLINPNGSGCDGIGQACPVSKLRNVCPNMDYACQNAWFTNYAVTRYGGWQQAYNFWLNNHWW